MGLLPDTKKKQKQLGVVHAPGIVGPFSPPARVSDPVIQHGTCVTHVPWCMPGSLINAFLLKSVVGKRSRYSRRMRNSLIREVHRVHSSNGNQWPTNSTTTSDTQLRENMAPMGKADTSGWMIIIRWVTNNVWCPLVVRANFKASNYKVTAIINNNKQPMI